MKSDKQPAWLIEDLTGVKEWIDAQPGYRITLSEIIAHSGYTRAHFCREFKRLFGCNPGKYVQVRALLAAKEMIDDGEIYAKLLPSRLGYASENSFIRAFKAQFGITPGAYIQQVQKGKRNAD